MPQTVTDQDHLYNLQERTDPRFLLILESHSGTHKWRHFFAYRASMTTEPDDSLPNTVFYDFISDIPSFDRSMGDALSGESQQSWSTFQVEHNNNSITSQQQDPATDAWTPLEITFAELIEHGFDGQAFTLYIGYPDYTFDDFRVFTQGFVSDEGLQIEDQYNFSFAVGDKMAALDADFTSNLFTKGGNQGEIMPTCLGGGNGNSIFNIKPLLEDHTVGGGVYVVHGGGEPIADIEPVRADGNPDVQYKKDLAHGRFELTSNPGSSDITCDAQGALWPAGHPISTMRGGSASVSAGGNTFGVDKAYPLPKNKTLHSVHLRKPDNGSGNIWVLMVEEVGENQYQVKFGAEITLLANETLWNNGADVGVGNAYAAGDIVTVAIADAVSTFGSATTPSDATYYLGWFGGWDGGFYTENNNLITNHSIESGTSSYSSVRSSITASTDWAGSGINSLKITPTGAGTLSYASQNVSIAPSKTYLLSALRYISAPLTINTNPRCNILWRDSLGVNISTSIGTALDNIAGAQRSVASGIAPANAASAFCMFLNGSDQPIDIVYWDDIILEEVSSIANHQEHQQVNLLANAATPTLDQTYTTTNNNAYSNIHICFGFEMNTAADICEYLLTQKAIPQIAEVDIDRAAFDTHKTNVSQTVGGYWGDAIRLLEIQSLMLSSTLSFMRMDYDGTLAPLTLSEPDENSTLDFTIQPWHYAPLSISVADTGPRYQAVRVRCRRNYYPNDKTQVAGTVSENDKAIFERQWTLSIYPNDITITGEIDGTAPPSVIEDEYFLCVNTAGAYTQNQVYYGKNAAWSQVTPLHDQVTLFIDSSVTGFTQNKYYAWDAVNSVWVNIGDSPKHPKASLPNFIETALLNESDASALAQSIASMYRDKRQTIQLDEAFFLGNILKIGDMVAFSEDETDALVAGKWGVVTGLPTDPSINEGSVVMMMFDAPT